MLEYKSSISFDCPGCATSVAIDIDVPEPNWLADSASDMIVDGESSFACPNCDTEILAKVFNTGGSCDVSFPEYPKVKVEAGHAYYDDDEDDDAWLEYDAPEDPYSVFMGSYRETIDLLNERGTESAGTINRMVFAQQIAALEAYLSDTLLNCVLEEPEAIGRLLRDERDLSNTKVSLAALYADSKLVEKLIKAHLRAIIYHNLPKVRLLYKIAFEFDIFDLLGKPDVPALLKSIEYRHDCVHRNGRDKDGNPIRALDKIYVKRTAEMLKRFVIAIDEKLYPRQLPDDGLDDAIPF